MGIALSGLNALLDLHSRFGDFGKTVQIGRQGLYIAAHEQAAADAAVRAHGLADSLSAIVASDMFADTNLLARLGAHPVMAADASPYEGATIIHDFNDPIPVEYHGLFNTLIESGSLEHIFNVPVALANMMRLLAIGGRLVSIAPANNWLGHGFYQLSPELPFRVFQPENGFRIISVKLVEGDGRSVELTDRGAEGYRNELGATSGTTDLITIAQKISDVAPFARWPKQGDYAHAWEIHDARQGV